MLRSVLRKRTHSQLWGRGVLPPAPTSFNKRAVRAHAYEVRGGGGGGNDGSGGGGGILAIVFMVVKVEVDAGVGGGGDSG